MDLGSFDWNKALDTLGTTATGALAAVNSNSPTSSGTKVMTTKAPATNAASTFDKYKPWIIGGAAVLLVVVVLGFVFKKR